MCSSDLQAADLQLLEEQARHNRFTRAGIVSKQKADARKLQKVLVHCLQLVRQRIDSCYRKRKEWVVLVGEPQPLRFYTKSEKTGITTLMR